MVRRWSDQGIIRAYCISRRGDRRFKREDIAQFLAELNLSWRYSVHLSSNDISARQRFTLYHEIFHILAHHEGTPVFKKTASSRGGSFNEFLADHFASIMLLPGNWVKKMWTEVKDLSQMAAIFDVPKPIVWFALKHLCLI